MATVLDRWPSAFLAGGPAEVACRRRGVAVRRDAFCSGFSTGTRVARLPGTVRPGRSLVPSADAFLSFWPSFLRSSLSRAPIAVAKTSSTRVLPSLPSAFAAFCPSFRSRFPSFFKPIASLRRLTPSPNRTLDDWHEFVTTSRSAWLGEDRVSNAKARAWATVPGQHPRAEDSPANRVQQPRRGTQTSPQRPVRELRQLAPLRKTARRR